MKGKVNRAEAHQSEGGLNPLYHFNVGMATAQFHFDTPQLVVAERRSRPAWLRGASFSDTKPAENLIHDIFLCGITDYFPKSVYGLPYVYGDKFKRRLFSYFFDCSNT